MSISAWYVLKKGHLELAKRSFTIALVIATICAWASLVSGDLQAKKVAETQPEKLAAIEGIYTTSTGGTPMYLFGIPNSRTQQIDFGIAVPRLLSFLVHGDADRPVVGLDKVPPDERPPVAASFYSYHLMIALGLMLIALTAIAVWFRWRKTLFEKRWLMIIFVF